MPRNKNCIENSTQKDELKNNQYENLINNDTFYFKRGATFFDGIKKIFCNNGINSIEDKEKNSTESRETNAVKNIKSRKYKLIKLVTMCAMMLLFNVAFSNSAYALDISTADQFINFANGVSTSNTYSGQTVNITADINLNNRTFTPMSGFAGTLDGKNHTISGINITSGTYRAVFGQITASPTIKNLTIVGTVNGSGADYAGGFCAYATGSPTFENCVNAVNVNGGQDVGGFIGHSYSGIPKIYNSYNTGAIYSDCYANYTYTGGIIGYIDKRL